MAGEPAQPCRPRHQIGGADVEAGMGEPDVRNSLEHLVVEWVVGLNVARVVHETIDQEAGAYSAGWSGYVVWGEIAPEPRPAIEVTILKTDPGTYRPWVARSSSGESSPACSDAM
jgi:hypothetical protein